MRSIIYRAIRRRWLKEDTPINHLNNNFENTVLVTKLYDFYHHISPINVQRMQSKGKPSEEAPKKVKYKRPRAQRACKTCHQRKVKCNLEQTYPERCTNCVQFNIAECVVPEIKKKIKTPLPPDATATRDPSPRNAQLANRNEGKSNLKQTQHLSNHIPDDDEFPFLCGIKLVPEKVIPKVRAKVLRDFVCSTTSSDFLKSTAEDMITNVMRMKHIERTPVSSFDMSILKYSGAFNLPDEPLCWQYINCYFEKLHPENPVLSKAAFMRDYKDLRNPPSILLLQSVIFAGARHLDDPSWTAEDREKHEKVVMLLFRRAKAIYDADVEIDPIPLCQTFSIFTWSCEGKLFTSRTTVHWIKLGVFSIQAYRMDKNQENASDLSYLEKKLYKRIFWSLYVKDRFVAMVFAQGFSIDLNKCTVPPLTAEDLSDDEPGLPSPYPANKEDIEYFLEKLKFIELLDVVVENQTSAKRDINYCDRLLAKWYNNLPSHLVFQLGNKQTQSVMTATLSVLYYTLLIVIHRTELVGRKLFPQNRKQSNSSWSTMFKAGHMIVCIVDELGFHAGLSQIISCCVAHAARRLSLFEIFEPVQEKLDSWVVCCHYFE
ncbi:unnamed protein product [Ambrosiozyma monospora]|uniref:Unnamed protein product n=1 Tax=Ambrosiozyma monospora TaxID=43982 RepID=A0ACB5SYX3_AMBMO|nr:unnamed protein product [Ambrosiozyma monospora]